MAICLCVQKMCRIQVKSSSIRLSIAKWKELSISQNWFCQLGSDATFTLSYNISVALFSKVFWKRASAGTMKMVRLIRKKERPLQIATVKKWSASFFTRSHYIMHSLQSNKQITKAFNNAAEAKPFGSNDQLALEFPVSRVTDFSERLDLQYCKSTNATFFRSLITSLTLWCILPCQSTLLLHQLIFRLSMLMISKTFVRKGEYGILSKSISSLWK